MTNTTILALAPTSHWFTDQKEQVYFTLDVELPRVGKATTRFSADRYVARMYDGGNTGRDAWTEWRVTRDGGPALTGVGPKTLEALYKAVDPAVRAWLAGPEYGPSRATAVASYIAREATTSSYGTVNARRLLVTFRGELTSADAKRLTKGIEHLEAGRALLNG